jgi:hypothetical protein
MIIAVAAVLLLALKFAAAGLARPPRAGHMKE